MIKSLRQCVENFDKSRFALPLALTALLLLFHALYTLRWPETAQGAFLFLNRPLTYYLLEGIALSAILARLRMEWWVTLLMLVSTMVQVAVLFQSDIVYWAPDINGHTEYITYMAWHNFMPPDPTGWHRQQPFVYYGFMAMIFRIALWLDTADAWHIVRLASRSLYDGYVIFALLLVREFRFPTLAKIAAVVTILFWPCIYSVSFRITNDIGFMFFFMASLLFLQRWHTGLVVKNLAIAMVCAGLSFLCKASGSMILLACAGVMLQALLSRRVNWRYFLGKGFLLGAALSAACIALYFGRIGYYRWHTGEHIYWFANIHQRGKMFPADLYYFLHFDLWYFITAPGYESVRITPFGFWSALIRTLLFGYFEFFDSPPRLLSIISVLWLVIAGAVLCQIGRSVTDKRIRQKYSVILWAFFSMLTLMIIQRSLIADAILSSGRYILPIIVAFAILAAGFLEDLLTHGRKLAYVTLCGVCFAFGYVSWITVVKAETHHTLVRPTTTRNHQHHIVIHRKPAGTARIHSPAERPHKIVKKIKKRQRNSSR